MRQPLQTPSDERRLELQRELSVDEHNMPLGLTDEEKRAAQTPTKEYPVPEVTAAPVVAPVLEDSSVLEEFAKDKLKRFLVFLLTALFLLVKSKIGIEVPNAVAVSIAGLASVYIVQSAAKEAAIIKAKLLAIGFRK